VGVLLLWGANRPTDAILVGDHPDEPYEIIQLIRAGSPPRIPGFRVAIVRRWVPAAFFVNAFRQCWETW
jgi:hypothetical protein